MTSSLVSRFSVKISILHPPRFHSLHFFYFSRHTCRYLVPTLFASREIIFTISTIVTRQPVSGRSYPPISIVLPRSWNPFSPFWLIDNDVCRTINLQKYFASSRVRTDGLKRKQLRSSHLSIVNVKEKKKKSIKIKIRSKFLYLFIEWITTSRVSFLAV